MSAETERLFLIGTFIVFGVCNVASLLLIFTQLHAIKEMLHIARFDLWRPGR